MKNIIKTFFTALITSALTIFVTHKYIIKEKVKTESVVKEVNITAADSIKESIDLIYDAVVIIETYKGNTSLGTGTGFVYKKDDEKGYILTNYHVVEDATKIEVTNNASVKVEATLLGSDSYADLAVLSVPSKEVLKVAKLGDSTKLALGDTLFTVGSPLGKEYMGTVTRGIVSSNNRLITVNNNNEKYMMEVIQTDASINPGNSGGPLVNIYGEVIGINSLKLVEDTIEGMGFAIPIEIAEAALEKLENGQEVKRPVLGVELIDVSNKYALNYHNLELHADITEGTVIFNIVADSPAEKAKLKKGDVILAINDVKTTDSMHFRFFLYKYQIGETIKITYNRNGKILNAEVKL
jgi:serine protease Do